ncbi:glycosyltransferase [Synechocystis sp. FACHB-383]|nr:glycosyltransferase [Synechocystis sp. FACHB-383]MBD2654455.1 glycosyltransferase [Synechocystis sp. FACHB-383]
MQRLHQSLQNIDIESQIYYRKGQSSLSPSLSLEFISTRSKQWQERIVLRLENELLQQKSNLFSPLQSVVKTPLPSTLAIVDIYHLHWISHWLDLPSFIQSLPPRSPIILTLHDLGNLTGGCHLYSGCHGFENICSPCPLIKYPFNHFLAQQELHRKQHLFSSRPVHVVGNSNWTTSLAKASAAFQGVQSIRTIYPAIDIQSLVRHDKAFAKKLLGISPQKLVLGFGCAELTDGNKNFPLFLQLLARLKDDIEPEAVVFGNDLGLTEQPPVPIHSLGKLTSSHLLSIAYSAMDVFVMASQTETFGMVAIEAQACGTPVCAFAVGGLTDAVQHEQTGFLAPWGNINLLSDHISQLLRNSSLRTQLGQTAHDWARRNFSLEQMRDAYLNLYREALKSQNT